MNRILLMAAATVLVTGSVLAQQPAPMPGMDKKGMDMKSMDMKGMDMKSKLVPGFPQDMMGMEMYTEAEIKKLNKPETRGMRKDWYNGVEGLMTVIRVLPDDLYDKVVSGKGEVAPGASVPGSTSSSGHEGHEGHKKP